MTDNVTKPETVHASSVALGVAAVLIIGPAGSGKSGLALALMALGARLIADDYTILWQKDGAVWARAPDQIRGQIEARGVGILAAETCAAAPVRLIVDLGRRETERLPPRRSMVMLGQSLPCLHKIDAPHFHAAIAQYMKSGRIA